MNDNDDPGCLVCLACLLIGLFIGSLIGADMKNGQIQTLQRSETINTELIEAYDKYYHAPNESIAVYWGTKIDSLKIVKKVKEQ